MNTIEQLAAPGVRGLRPYEPGKPVEELERELGISGAIKLASNENPLGPSDSVLAAMQAACQTVARYPDGNSFALKSALAGKLGVAQDQLTLGNGSNDILELIVRAFVTPDNSVVFSQHAFAVYPIVTQAVGAQAVIVPAKNWGHDLDAMAAAVRDDTRVVFIANPNNPTGTWLSGNAVRDFVGSMPAHVIVVLDEAYYEYANAPGTAADGYESLLNDVTTQTNLIVTRTFSKAYGLAGLRVGYGVSSTAVADYLNRVRQPFNLNSIAEAAAVAALADEQHLQRSIEVNCAGLRQLTSAFDEMGLDYIPSAANFISVEVGDDGRAVYDRLLHEGVIVRPVDNYAMPRHLRITISTQDENSRLIEALRKVLGK
ncbi:MAG: histidinol-phosphate transaminase [Granulosicoccaceae bacterium]|jgi:histidinol-phosphate aminotransferase